MLKKKQTKKGIQVTFELDHLADAETVELVGEFNGWQPEPMTKYKNGKHKLVTTVDAGRDYQFRYRVDGAQWQNDPQADRYVTNEHGSQNSVLSC